MTQAARPNPEIPLPLRVIRSGQIVYQVASFATASCRPTDTAGSEHRSSVGRARPAALVPPDRNLEQGREGAWSRTMLAAARGKLRRPMQSATAGRCLPSSEVPCLKD